MDGLPEGVREGLTLLSAVEDTEGLRESTAGESVAL